MTNAEWIRNADDDELADFLARVTIIFAKGPDGIEGYTIGEETALKSAKEYLKEEYKRRCRDEVS